MVPAKNRARFLRETLDSILTQDYPRIECIVMDAGSTDGTVELLESYGSGIQWVSEPDDGPAAAINAGWARSQGEIQTWLNADDRWAPGAARRAATYFETHPEVDVIFGNCDFVDRQGKPAWTLKAKPWSLERSLMLCDHIIDQPASFMRRRVLKRVGALRGPLLHDQDLWLRIGLAGGKFAAVPEHLADERLYSENFGSNPELVVPLKVHLIERIFDEGVPARYAHRRRRAVSNAHVRGFDSLQPADLRYWKLGVATLARAIRADPTNTPHVLGHLAYLFARHVRRGLRDPRRS